MSSTKLDRKNRNLERVDEEELTPSLIRLDLSKNVLKGPLDLLHLVELRWLNLSKNALTSLDGFASLPNLRVLNVSYNKLEGKVNVGKLRELTALVLNSNAITSVAGLEKLPRLETLIVSNNQITEFGGWISQATSLTKLSASNNPNVVNFSGLKALTAMKELRLNSTGLRRPADVVQGMRTLRILEVGGSNTIESWDDVGALPRGVWQLNLKGTPLSARDSYEQEVVARFPQLDVIDGRRRHEKNTRAGPRVGDKGEGDKGEGSKGEGNKSEGDKGEGDKSEDDALDPDAFAAAKDGEKSSRGTEKRKDTHTREYPPPAKSKKKKKKDTKSVEKSEEAPSEGPMDAKARKRSKATAADIQRILHAAKDQQLASW
jgi:hypothetical protein